MSNWSPHPVRVSVLITTYNHEAYIGRAIEGVLEQTGTPFELLVGDDCSTDGTRSVIDRYVRGHPDIVRAHYPDQNRGGGGKNLFRDLIELSSGEYIAGMDGDDYWTSDGKLRLQVAYLDDHPQCSMVFHNVVRRFEDDDRPDDLFQSPDLSRRLGWDQLIRSNPVPACSPLFRREVIDPLPSWYFELPWGDWPLYFMALEMGEVHYLPDVLGVFRFHDRGIHSRLPNLARRRNEVDFFRRLADVLPSAGDDRLKWRLAFALSRLADAQFRAGDRDAARASIAESFRVWPLDPRRMRRGHGDRTRLALWARTRREASPFRGRRTVGDVP